MRKPQKTKKNRFSVPMHQLNFRINDEVVKGIDRFVDGIHYRSRGHLINVILLEWLERQEKGDHVWSNLAQKQER